jgi:hypothetical protein
MVSFRVPDVPMTTSDAADGTAAADTKGKVEPISAAPRTARAVMEGRRRGLNIARSEEVNETVS